MKLLLDAQLSYRIADLLTQQGYDVHAVTKRVDLPSNAPDAEILDRAHYEGRVVVTSNVKDFRPLAAERVVSGQGHSGLLLVSARTPRTKAATARLASAIEAAIHANPQGIANSERWI